MDQNSGAPMMGTTDAADSNSDFNVNIQDQLGVPPAPPIPDFLKNEPSMPGVNPNVMADLTNSGPTPILGDNAETGATMKAPAEAAVETTIETPTEAATVENESVAMNAAEPETAVKPEMDMNAGVMITEGGEASDVQFEEVKKQMLQDLYPLMDKIKMQPEQKFKVYKQMIETTGSKEMIASAYEAVKGIGNEEERAEALLFLVEKADV